MSAGAPGSLRSSRPQWAERAKTRSVKEPKQRIVVFQLGGMTYSEIRSAYKVAASANREIFIGGRARSQAFEASMFKLIRQSYLRLIAHQQRQRLLEGLVRP